MRRPFRHTLAGAAIVCLAISALSLLAPSAPNDRLGVGQAVARAGGCSYSAARPARVPVGYMQRAVFCLVNSARRRHNLRPYRPSRKLARAARRHSHSMVVHDYFSHNGPRGSSPGDRIARTGYFDGARRWSWGENIAAGKRRDGSPREVLRAWMHSPVHRSVILSPTFREMGVGIVRGFPDARGRNSATYTLDLGFRRR